MKQSRTALLTAAQAVVVVAVVLTLAFNALSSLPASAAVKGAIAITDSSHGTTAAGSPVTFSATLTQISPHEDPTEGVDFFVQSGPDTIQGCSDEPLTPHGNEYIATCTTTGLMTGGTDIVAAQYGADGADPNYPEVTTGDGANGNGPSDVMLVALVAPTTPTISNLPSNGQTVGGSFVANVATSSDGVVSVTSNTVFCTVASDGLTVTYTGLGQCSLTAHVATSPSFTSADGSAQTFSVVASVTYTPPPVFPIPTPSSTPSPVVAQPDGVFPSDLGAPVSGVAQSTAPTAVTLSLNSGTGKATSTILIPEGALPSGTVVNAYPVTNTAPLMAQVPDGQAYLDSFAVTWLAPDGSSPLANEPITLAIVDPSIVAGDVIYQLTSTGLTQAGVAPANGFVLVTFTGDPTFVVTAPALLAQAPLRVTSTKGVVGSARTLAASGGSGTGLVSYSVADGTARGCAISGDSLNSTSAGTCVVTASKAADETYAGATITVSVSFATPLNKTPTPVAVTFKGNASTLSVVAKTQVEKLARQLVIGDTVTIVGYAKPDTLVATSRARAVETFLKGLVNVTIKTTTVTNVALRQARIFTSK